MTSSKRTWTAGLAAVAILVVTAAPAGADGRGRSSHYSPRSSGSGRSSHYSGNNHYYGGGYNNHHNGHYNSGSSWGGFFLGVGVGALLDSAFYSPPRPRYYVAPAPYCAPPAPCYAPAPAYYAPPEPQYVPQMPAYAPQAPDCQPPAYTPAPQQAPCAPPQQAPCEQDSPIYVPETTGWQERTVVERAVYETRCVPEYADVQVPVFENRRVPVYGEGQSCDPVTGARTQVVVGERIQRVQVGTRLARRFVGQHCEKVCVRPEVTRRVRVPVTIPGHYAQCEGMAQDQGQGRQSPQIDPRYVPQQRPPAAPMPQQPPQGQVIPVDPQQPSDDAYPAGR